MLLTPVSLATNRLSRCSRVLTNPVDDSLPASSINTAYGSFATP